MLPTDHEMTVELAVDATIGRAVADALANDGIGVASYTVTSNEVLMLTVWTHPLPKGIQLDRMEWRLATTVVTALQARQLIGERIASMPQLFAEARAKRANRRHGNTPVFDSPR